MERLLRGSGKYSYAWLKKKALPWHPDQVGRRCDPDFRVELTRKANFMFAVFGELMNWFYRVNGHVITRV